MCVELVVHRLRSYPSSELKVFKNVYEKLNIDLISLFSFIGRHEHISYPVRIFRVFSLMSVDRQ